MDYIETKTNFDFFKTKSSYIFILNFYILPYHNTVSQKWIIEELPLLKKNHLR